MLLSLVASAATGIEIDGIFYHFNSTTKTAEVARWAHGLKYTGDVVIPSTVTRNEVEYSVTSIEANAFANCSELISVTIPNSVTTLGKNLFNGCTNLASIVVEEGNPVYDSRENCNALIETASNKVIYGCSGSTIPDGITTIGNSAFLNCIGLTSIVIPNSVTTIENSAFEGCTGLTSFIIPDAVTNIEGSILSNCTGLSYLYIGKGITNLEEEAFTSCDNLKTVEINNNAIVLNKIAWFFNSSVKEYILGEDVTSIGDYAFYRCSMTSVKMSNNVTSIGDYAFEECTNLTSIVFSNNLVHIGKWAFAGCMELPSVTIPQSVKCIDLIAFQWCYKLTKVEVNSNEVVSRDGEQFYTLTSCFGKQVEEYVLGEDVKKIAYIAFSESDKLTSVTISSNLTCVDDSAFHKCTSLTDMYCYAEQVPETGKDIFVESNYTNATLHVPAASVEAYKNAEQWKDFGNIVALTDEDPSGMQDIVIGDANGDNEVNITDITYIIDKINDKPATDFNEKAADLNEDGEINITDVTLLLDKINGCDK